MIVTGPLVSVRPPSEFRIGPRSRRQFGGGRGQPRKQGLGGGQRRGSTIKIFDLAFDLA